MKQIKILFSMLLLISCCCLRSSDDDLDKIKQLEKQQAERLKHLPSIAPVEGGKIINRFGQQGDSLRNKGINITIENEADVFATAAGKIVEAKKGATTDENLIIIDHGYGFQTKYANLSEILVEANQSVKRWTAIGRMKKTSDQPALLHYEVIKDGENVDPERYIF